MGRNYPNNHTFGWNRDVNEVVGEVHHCNTLDMVLQRELSLNLQDLEARTLQPRCLGIINISCIIRLHLARQFLKVFSTWKRKH